MIKTVVLILVSFVSIASVIVPYGREYFRPYYTEEVYRQLENLFNQSQYRQKEPTALIADDVVFRYAAGAYIRGVDPILINSEHTPLGKYFIGMSILLFHTDAYAILFSAILTLVALWFLSREAFASPTLALVPVALFSIEKLFLNQLRVTPLLDIVQLPYILFALYSFLRESRKKYFFITSLCLGLVMAIKSIVPAFLLILSFCLFLLIIKRTDRIIHLFISLPLAMVILLGSYTRTFLSGYTLIDFIGFQKWILLYQQSKLILPFSFWRLMVLNQWQTWWGNRAVHRVEDWNILWPILTILPFMVALFVIKKKISVRPAIILLLIWIFVYEAFLSTGAVVTRFLLPLLPALYIIAIYSVVIISRRRL